MYSRLFDTNFESSYFDFGPEPETLPEPPRPQQETLADASLWRLNQSINVLDPYTKGNTKSTLNLKLAPEKFRPGKNLNTWLFLFENYLKEVGKIEWLSCLWTMLDEKCLNDNYLDCSPSYEEIRAELLEIYGENSKTKSKTSTTSTRENVLKFSNCYQNSN